MFPKRIRCTKSEYGWWRVGKIYTVSSAGQVKADDGNSYDVRCLLRGSDTPSGRICYSNCRAFESLNVIYLDGE